MKRAFLILSLLVISCKYKLPESRVGDYVWFGELWTDTLDTSIVYFDTVYTGTDKLGYGMTGGVVWFVVGDTSDTACSRDFRDRDVYQFYQSDEFDKRYRFTFYNWDDTLNDRVFKEGKIYTFCAANIVNGIAEETLKLKGVFPTKPKYNFYDTLIVISSDTFYLNDLPDTLYTDKEYTFIWQRGYKANWYMLRFVGRDTTFGFYYCYKEVLDTLPSITVYIPKNSDECYYSEGPIRLELVNVYRVLFDYGYAFGEFRFMSRVIKEIVIR
ncbi:MAG: hypothetical protein ABIL50_00170 [candidate division WOR-3 bacterium]